MSSPTKRTMDYLRKHGSIIEVVERFNQFSKTRKDLFSCIDMVEIRYMTSPVLVGVQATTDAMIQDHIRKCFSDIVLPKLMAWMETGNQFEIWGWAKKGPRGKRKLWVPRVFQAELQTQGKGRLQKKRVTFAQLEQIPFSFE
jgi:hypothetical protein